MNDGKANARSRSSRYQYKLLEKCFENDTIAICFSHNDAKEHISDEEKERLQELDDKLGEEIHKILEECLTKRQKMLYDYAALGHTQHEVAAKMGVNQS